MDDIKQSHYSSRLPWTVMLAAWLVFCGLVVGMLYGWHANERRACERQASGLARTLAATLRTMSRRVTESQEVLLEVLEETISAATLTGIALTDSAGRPAAAVGIEPEMLARTGVTPEGVLFLREQVLVWIGLHAPVCDTGDPHVGRGWGGRRNAWAGPAEEAPEDGHIRPVRLVISMPHDVCQTKWLYARMVAAAIGVVGLLLSLGLGQFWTMARRNAAYAVQLRLADQEKQALEDLNLVAAGLAHEIKNPLGVIRGTAQRLCGPGIEGEESAEAPAIIVDEIDRVTSRIDELLSFARPREPVLCAVSLLTLCREIELLMAGDLSDEGLELRLPSDDVCVLADREQLRLTLFNLLHNVVRFAAGTGTVCVDWRQTTERTCMVSVRDHGPGLADSIKAKAFAPYVTSSASGTGLGLAIVRRIAIAHGWQVACRNAPDGGALFEINDIHVSTENPIADSQS